MRSASVFVSSSLRCSAFMSGTLLSFAARGVTWATRNGLNARQSRRGSDGVDLRRELEMGQGGEPSRVSGRSSFAHQPAPYGARLAGSLARHSADFVTEIAQHLHEGVPRLGSP